MNVKEECLYCAEPDKSIPLFDIKINACDRLGNQCFRDGRTKDGKNPFGGSDIIGVGVLDNELALDICNWQFAIKINYCPICGRNIKEKEN